MNQSDLPTYIVIDEYTKDCILDSLINFDDTRAGQEAMETLTLHSDASYGSLLEICDLSANEYAAIIRALDLAGNAEAVQMFNAAIASEQKS